MYIATITYRVNEEVKNFTHNVEESYIHVAEHGDNCNFVIPADTTQVNYEHLVANHYDIENVTLSDENGTELYVSTYWNRAIAINHAFPMTGEPRCDVQFAHVDPSEQNA